MERFRFSIRPVAVFAGIIGVVCDIFSAKCGAENSMYSIGTFQWGAADNGLAGGRNRD